MRFILSSRMNIDESNAAEFDAFPCEVWHTETFYTANEIDRKVIAVRDSNNNMVLDKDGEPKFTNRFTIVDAKPPKNWYEEGYDHEIEKIAPIYNPNYKTGGWISTVSGKELRSSDGIENSGALQGKRKLKSTLYCVEFDSYGFLKKFVDYIIKHSLEIQEVPHPTRHWINYIEVDEQGVESDTCYTLYQSWNEYND